MFIHKSEYLFMYQYVYLCIGMFVCLFMNKYVFHELVFIHEPTSLFQNIFFIYKTVYLYKYACLCIILFMHKYVYSSYVCSFMHLCSWMNSLLKKCSINILNYESACFMHWFAYSCIFMFIHDTVKFFSWISIF